jgi:hypothetical protein
MKKVLVVLERSKFNYLYKYDTCRVSPENIINNSYEELLHQSQISFRLCAERLELSLPIFEQEHEVIIIEYLNEKIGYNSGIELSFNGVLQIIPLNKIAKELLSTKISNKIKISDPLPIELYENTLLLREEKVRHQTSNRLLKIFDLPQPNKLFVNKVKEASSYKILDKKVKGETSSLYHLLDFDITPSFIPEGNSEGLIKVACVAARKVGTDISIVPKSYFYNITVSNIKMINGVSLLTAYEYLEKMFQVASVEDVKKIEHLKNTLRIQGIEENIMLIYYLFFSFKKILKKNEFDVTRLADSIYEFKESYPNEVAATLYLLGYTLSMSSLFESIQAIEKAPILKSEVKNFSHDAFSKKKSKYSAGEIVKLRIGNTEPHIDLDVAPLENGITDIQNTEVLGYIDKINEGHNNTGTESINIGKENSDEILVKGNELSNELKESYISSEKENEIVNSTGSGKQSVDHVTLSHEQSKEAEEKSPVETDNSLKSYDLSVGMERIKASQGDTLSINKNNIKRLSNINKSLDMFSSDISPILQNIKALVDKESQGFPKKEFIDFIKLRLDQDKPKLITDVEDWFKGNDSFKRKNGELKRNAMNTMNALITVIEKEAIQL